MRLLVTGGLGFIGAHVVAAALEAGHAVRVLDRRPLADVAVPVAVRPAVTDVERVTLDVRDEAGLGRALVGVEAVVHLAAKVGLGDGVLDAAEYCEDNAVGTSAVVAAMQRADVGRLVVASSMVVYGAGTSTCPVHGRTPVPGRTREALEAGRFEPLCPTCGRDLAPDLVGEDTALAPLNVYAATKVVQEHLSLAWARASGGVATALRFHNVYGPGLPRDTPYAGVAALFLSALRRGEAPQVFEDGGQRRDLVHVRDVARANVAALGGGEPGSLRAFNVGSGTPRTIGELAGALADATGGPRPVVTGRFRMGDVRHITASSESAAANLPWRASEVFEEAMAELAEHV